MVNVDPPESRFFKYLYIAVIGMLVLLVSYIVLKERVFNSSRERWDRTEKQQIEHWRDSARNAELERMMDNLSRGMPMDHGMEERRRSRLDEADRRRAARPYDTTGAALKPSTLGESNGAPFTGPKK